MQKIFALLGRKVMNFFAEFGEIALLGISVIKYSTSIIKDKKLILEQMKIVGSDSLPLVLLIGTFTGAISALQATDLFQKFNLLTIAFPYIGSSVATAVFALTPVLTSLVVAGRVGGSMAAQIGSMKVTEQLDALEIMAIDKRRYLAMPRVIALMFMLPVLVIFSNFVAIFGAFAFTAIVFDFTPSIFFDSIQKFFRVSEIVLALSKSITFGIVIALIACNVGFKTTGGAEGVGASTVRAYTWSAAPILIIDAIFGYLA